MRKLLTILTILLLVQFSTDVFAECIEGNCDDGYGKYIFSSGSEYVGEWKDGKQNGQGSLVTPSGHHYVGEWKDGKRNGQGIFTFTPGDRYMGGFKDNEYHGQGTYTSANGDKYVGEHKESKRHGQGTYTWADGGKYVGEWKNDEPNGQGTNTLADGDQYVGEWKDGKVETLNELVDSDIDYSTTNYLSTLGKYLEYTNPSNSYEGKTETQNRIYNACVVDKSSQVDMQVNLVREAVQETCEAIAEDPSWLDGWKYE